MKFSDYFFSPVVRLLSFLGGTLTGGVVAAYGIFTRHFTPWVWGVLIGAGTALLLSFLVPFRFWVGDAPYRRVKATLPQPFLLEHPVRFTVPGGAVNGYLILTKQSIVLLSFERGEQRMELAREDIRSILLEENGIKIILSNTKFVSFSSVNFEEIYQLLRREGWNA